MSNPARGTKRVCPSCGARFYDLGREPITCPVCQAAYEAPAPAPSRRTPPPQAQAPAQPDPPPKPAAAEEPDTPVMGGAEVISLDEASEAEEAAVEDEEIVDLGDDEDIPAADDEEDNTFLEQDEDGNEDVSDIVGDGAKEES